MCRPAYPAPLLAERMDGEALDEMLRMLDEEGRVVKPRYGPGNKWYRHKRWEIPFNRDHVPEPLPRPVLPVHEGEDRWTRLLRERAIELYCRQVWDLEDR